MHEESIQHQPKNKKQPWKNIVLVVSVVFLMSLVSYHVGKFKGQRITMDDSGLRHTTSIKNKNKDKNTTNEEETNQATSLLKDKWIYLLGDSSLRMFNSALISCLNGTLEDPRFGSFWIHDKGSCKGNQEEDAAGSNCL